MDRFQRICEVLHYIEDHLDVISDYEQVAGAFCYSPYYFHRLFSAVAGKPIATYLRERRLAKAAGLLADPDKTITSICFDCGFNSSQSFCRAFRNSYGVSPTDYRRLGYTPVIMSVEEIVQKFKNKVSDNGYEVRIYNDTQCRVHVGLSVSDSDVDSAFTVMRLPASAYAAFEVYVAEGYDSGNDAMNEWIETNKKKHRQRTIDGDPYVVEFYDERFHGDSEDSIVEIWVPVEPVK